MVQKNSILLYNGVVTHKRKSLDADLRLIFCSIDLLLYVPVNSYGHVGTLDVEMKGTMKKVFEDGSAFSKNHK